MSLLLCLVKLSSVRHFTLIVFSRSGGQEALLCHNESVYQWASDTITDQTVLEKTLMYKTSKLVQAQNVF